MHLLDQPTGFFRAQIGQLGIVIFRFLEWRIWHCLMAFRGRLNQRRFHHGGPVGAPGHEPADPVTPEQIYERRWALALLEEVLRKLRLEHEREGRLEFFTALHPCLVGERGGLPYQELAAKLGVSAGAVKSAVHRLRQRYRELLRHEIAQTVAEPGEVDEELRHLFVVLGNR